jgi:hypothetical protein
MSPVPHARSAARTSGPAGAISTSRRFQRASRPYDSNTVIRSYLSAMVAKSRRT